MLDELLETQLRIQDTQKKALKRLNIITVRDLLYHFPMRYESAGDQTTVSGLVAGTDAVLYGTIRKPETRRAWKSKRPMSEAWLEDGTGKIKLMWFNQPYIAKMLTDGGCVKISGRVEGKSSVYVANPEVEHISELPVGGVNTVFGTNDSTELFAVYPETKGVTSRWFRHAIQKLLSKGCLDEIEELLPFEILEQNNLPHIEKAMLWIHQPKKVSHKDVARKRFAFEEIFLIQLSAQQLRINRAHEKTFPIPNGKDQVTSFIERLPFTLTKGQQRAIDAILEDVATPPAMGRLLEGDVGSGKTAIATAVSYAVVQTPPEHRPSARLQVAYMAPTEILAEQQFASCVEYFGHLSMQIGLITSSGCKKFPSKVDATKPTNISKTQLLKWIANGEIALVVGTHALIQKNVSFRELGLVIIDEQHRFGTTQRQTLSRKDGRLPHLLSMTATPIPRTLALTLYGDLDLTILDEMPPGRKEIETAVVGTTGRRAMYEAVRRELDEGRQAYVICPRIEEPNPDDIAALQVRSVEAETERLKRTEFKNYRVASLHGQLSSKEKDAIMRQFLEHTIDVLVATSVVEVGVNVPNATTIIIEGAERFGLAQLHQLRGRVVRSVHQAYCYVLTTNGGTSKRLQAFVKAKNGFELAEQDLKIRGPGELYGRNQSGMSDVGMEALKNIKMVETARAEAQKLITQDPTLQKHRILQAMITARQEKIHLE
jgi:ATP-dependent DNA helicase RecG